MTLSAGDHLGPYEILAPLGAGGMGEVYQARDTRLRREVAIKVLPERLAHDPDRMARFEREARLLASLDHPHIGAIFGLEESGGTQALILAYIAGPTLAERIAAGPIPLEDAIAIARQMAEALEYAHERGVIHRDLKPANVKITPQGAVKVLDFGLAKALTGESEAAASAASPTVSPTLSMRATQAGVILGTAAYMAPEQAKGKHVDRRADIWAFGVVLFEMLTGEALFTGDSVAEILASALKEEPRLDRLPAGTPAAVRRLIARCLHKDPRQRLRDIGEARIALENVGAEPETAVSPAAEKSRNALLPWLVAGTMTVAAAVAWWAPWRIAAFVDQPLRRLDVDLGSDVALPNLTAGGADIALSPDGTRLAYSSGTPRKLFLRRLDQPVATEMPGTEGAEKPFFSPDGRWVGFPVHGKLNKISVEGGEPLALATIPSFGGASWDADGSLVVSLAPVEGLVRIPAGGGASQTVAEFTRGDTAFDHPRILPGGKAILLSAAAGSLSHRNIEVFTLADRRRKIVLRGGATPRYVPVSDRLGYLIYSNRATLFAVAFDPAKLEARGTGVPVVDGVAFQTSTGSSEYDVTPAPAGHGTLVYRRVAPGATGASTLQWVDAAGKRQALPAKPDGYLFPVVSPDGKRIAYSLSDGDSTDVWVYDIERDAATRLTFGGANYRILTWSPDGRYVVSGSRGSIVQVRADGSGQPQPLLPSDHARYPWSFSADGKRLAYSDSVGGFLQIWTVAVTEQGGRLQAGQPEQFLKSGFSDTYPAFSPDGRWLAYCSDDSGRLEVYVRPFPPSSSSPAGKVAISNGGGVSPHWSPNGHELIYRSGDQAMAVSYTVKGDTFVAGKPTVWITRIKGTVWDLAPDGKRILVVTPVGSPDAPQQEHEVVLLENFLDYLRQRVPVPAH